MKRVVCVLGCGPSLCRLRPDQYAAIQAKGATIIAVHSAIDYFSTPDIFFCNVIWHFMKFPDTWDSILACKRRVLADDLTLKPEERMSRFESWRTRRGVENTGLKAIPFAFRELHAECVVLCGVDMGSENIITGHHVPHIGNPYRYKRSGKMLKIGGAYPCPEISVDALMNFKS